MPDLVEWPATVELTEQLTVPAKAATGVAAVDTASVQALHDALPAAGGKITLQPTYGTPYDLTNGLVLTKQVHLLGAGPADADFTQAGTMLRSTSQTVPAITSTANGSTFEGFGLVNTAVAAPTAGAGIAITAGGRGNRYVDIAVRGFYIDIDIQQGYEWYMSRCYCYDFVQFGLHVQDIGRPDGGDPGISDCFFIAGPTNLTPTAAVRYESGGGLKMINCKINTRGGTLPYGFYASFAAGISTSDLLLTNNSIENVSLAGIRVTAVAGATFLFLVICGNQISCGGVGASKAIQIDPAVAGLIGEVMLDNNIAFANGTAGTGIYVRNVSGLHLGDNHILGNFRPIDIDATATASAFASVMAAPAALVGNDGGATTFLSDWANAGSWRPLSYWLHGGYCYLEGVIVPGTGKAATAAIFTLPAAFRPPASPGYLEYIPALLYSGGAAAPQYVWVAPSGLVSHGLAVAGLQTMFVKGRFRVDGY